MVNNANKIVIDLPADDDDAELVVSHTVSLGNIEFRVLEEPSQWHLLRSSTDPISLIRAFVHPDDFRSLDTLLSSRRTIPEGVLTSILTAITEKPTGYPTTASGEPSTT